VIPRCIQITPPERHDRCAPWRQQYGCSGTESKKPAADIPFLAISKPFAIRSGHCQQHIHSHRISLGLLLVRNDEACRSTLPRQRLVLRSGLKGQFEIIGNRMLTAATLAWGY
jgi:hypothetical protein